jgi:glucose uptake protein
MFIVNSYSLAVVFCFITMLCWGSWGNTQKLAAKSWRYELFYWDYVIGMVIFALLMAFTMGSIGSEGRPFIADMEQASWASIGSIILGGVIFNASNILLSASTSIAGLSVAFPLGVGLALVLGVINNYIVDLQQGTTGNIALLAIGVALIVIAIICNGIASGKKEAGSESDKAGAKKGIILAIIAGILMSFFYRFVASSMDLKNFANPEAGKVTPYTAIVIFTIGVFLSNFIFNTIVMRHPFVGQPVSYNEYFKGKFNTHLVGMLGGAIWCLGTALSYICSGKAGAAISYALGQGAPMIAAIWGVFVWKEFKGAKKSVYGLLAVMFVFFIAGLGFIIAAGN